MLAQIRNAQAAGHESAVLPFSKIKFEIAKILRDRGFLAEVEKKKQKGLKTEFEILSLKLKYKEGKGVISGAKMVSKPSRRVYTKKNELRQIRSGYGLAIVSTPKGLTTADQARKSGVGGEILFEIW